MIYNNNNVFINNIPSSVARAYNNNNITPTGSIPNPHHSQLARDV